MKQQLLIIHGGDTFDTYEEYLSFLRDFEVDINYFTKKGWKSSLQEKLGDNFEVIAPAMPNKMNAKYLEWKIWFEKLTPFINDDVILAGHSLGGIFLAKYLSENNFPKKIRATFLIAAPFDDVDSDYTLGDFTLPADLSGLEKQGGNIFVYHSKDDSVVPFVDLEKYRAKLTTAKFVVFEDKDHFGQAEFPELVKEILSLV